MCSEIFGRLPAQPTPVHVVRRARLHDHMPHAPRQKKTTVLLDMSMAEADAARCRYTTRQTYVKDSSRFASASKSVPKETRLASKSARSFLISFFLSSALGISCSNMKMA